MGIVYVYILDVWGYIISFVFRCMKMRNAVNKITMIISMRSFLLIFV